MTTPTRAVDSPRVWTTLLTNTKYLPGLLALEYSLRRVGSKYPFLVLYTSSLEPEGLEALKKRGIPAQEIPYLLPSVHKDYGVEVRFYDCWSKLQPFNLVEYERIVQLDSDMIVVKNMDELMELELNDTDRIFAASHACTCNPFKKPHYPKDWIPENCSFTHQHADPAYAQLHGAPTNTGLAICNGGLQVVNPSKELYEKIQAAMAAPDKTDNYEFADQSLLSDLFKDAWVPLSYKYNALKTLRDVHSEIWMDDEVKNVHYILTPKPWELKDESNELFKWWWNINDERHAAEKTAGLYDGF
ncbi:nucleotide-diphospho-sugar transferase [Dipodascopsis tothii]|uniref:nucleotide-diphospho-sugar transferase n=1 Tax=Dipodascopsis tothii TaxID=44089 RepID=UPI0034CD9372